MGLRPRQVWRFGFTEVSSEGFGGVFLVFDFGLILEDKILDLSVTSKGGTKTKYLEPLIG